MPRAPSATASPAPCENFDHSASRAFPRVHCQKPRRTNSAHNNTAPRVIAHEGAKLRLMCGSGGTIPWERDLSKPSARSDASLRLPYTAVESEERRVGKECR